MRKGNKRGEKKKRTNILSFKKGFKLVGKKRKMHLQIRKRDFVENFCFFFIFDVELSVKVQFGLFCVCERGGKRKILKTSKKNLQIISISSYKSSIFSSYGGGLVTKMTQTENIYMVAHVF